MGVPQRKTTLRLVKVTSTDDREIISIPRLLTRFGELQEKIENLVTQQTKVKDKLKAITLNEGINVKPDFPEDRFILAPEQGVKLHHYNSGRCDYNEEAIKKWAKREGVSISSLFPRKLDTRAFRKHFKNLTAKQKKRMITNKGIYAFRIRELSSKGCTECGEELKKSAKFCSECGATTKVTK